MRIRPSRSRVVTYRYALESDDEQVHPSLDEEPIERLLSAYRSRGVLTQYDTGRGRIVWFEGVPGPAMRKLRRELLCLAPSLR